jgi:hypothetical protein
MLKHTFKKYLVIFSTVLFFISCGKGYKVRVSNYSTERIDSVVIGNNKLILKEIDPEKTTDLYSLSKGNYSVTFINKSKKRFSTKLFISSEGGGQRTLQIDGLNQISVLEE